jgi:hypothetical protein
MYSGKMVTLSPWARRQTTQFAFKNRLLAPERAIKNVPTVFLNQSS